MSEIKVNKISPATSTDITLGDSGDTFTVPSGATIVNSGTATGFGGGGKIIQVVHALKDDTWTSSSQQTWEDVTDLTVTTATLASSSSTVLVYANFFGGGVGDYTYCKVVDGSGSDITGFVGASVGSRTACSSGNFYMAGLTAADYMNMNINGNSGMWLDSPGVTTAQTYKVQMWCASATTHYFNRSKGDGDSLYYGRPASTITAWEIGA